MATLFVLMLFLAVVGAVAVELIEAGGIRNHSRSEVMNRRYLGKYKEN